MRRAENHSKKAVLVPRVYIYYLTQSRTPTASPLLSPGAVGRQPVEAGVDGRHHPAVQGEDGLPEGHAPGAPGQVRLARPRGAPDRQACVRGGQRSLHRLRGEGESLNIYVGS